MDRVYTINKGTGSVANGFESIAGQINVELKKTWNLNDFMPMFM